MTKVKSVKEQMSEIAARAKAIKNDPNIKHHMTENQIKEAKENTILMLPYQYETLKEN